MILGVDKLQKLVEKNNLVEGLCKRERENPEGAGFDLRLGEVHELASDGFLGIEERNTPDTKLIAEFDPEQKERFVFEPGQYYLVKTIEKVHTPDDIAVLFRPRSSMFRSGLNLLTGNVSPGYEGELIFGLCNPGSQKIGIDLGARIVHAMFYEVKGETNSYRGQWQNGRVTTDKREKQV